MKRIFAVLCIATLVGCSNDKQDQLYPAPVTPPPSGGGGDTVSFSAKVLPILTSKCAIPACHDANSLGGGYNLSSHTGAKDAAPRMIGAIKWQPGYSQMPKGMPQLDAASIDLIAKWVNQGALNN